MIWTYPFKKDWEVTVYFKLFYSITLLHDFYDLYNFARYMDLKIDNKIDDDKNYGRFWDFVKTLQLGLPGDFVDGIEAVFDGNMCPQEVINKVEFDERVHKYTTRYVEKYLN